MNHTDILNQISSLLTSSEKALKDLEKDSNITFNTALIQKNCIDIFNLTQQLHSLEKHVQHTEAKSEANIVIEKVKINSPNTMTKPEPQEQIQENKQEAKVIENISAKEEIANPIIEAFVEPIITKEIPVIEPPKTEEIASPTPNKLVAEETKPSTVPPATIASSKAEEEDLSINEKISKNKQPIMNVSDKSRETSIPDLSKAISIGKKFEFINDLFDGNSEHYKSSIQYLQNAENYQSAINYIETEITNKYNWNDNEHLAAEFFSLIKRRHN